MSTTGQAVNVHQAVVVNRVAGRHLVRLRRLRLGHFGVGVAREDDASLRDRDQLRLATLPRDKLPRAVKSDVRQGDIGPGSGNGQGCLGRERDVVGGLERGDRQRAQGRVRYR